MLAAVIIGFLVERLVRGEALQGIEREQFIDRVSEIFATVGPRPANREVDEQAA